MTRPLLLLANGAAGSTERGLVDEAVDALGAHGPVEVAWTEDADAVGEVLAELGDRRLVVAGGDGSVSVAVNALHRIDRLDAEVAIIPLGTGNDLAGALGLDRELAIEAASGDRIVELDLIETDHGVCVNALHLGLGAVAARRGAALKERLGAVAYPVGAFVAGFAATTWRCSVEVDGGVVADGDHLLVALGNGHRVGGGFPLVAGAEHDDGTIDVVVAAGGSRIDRLRLAAAARKGRHGKLPFVTRARGRHVVIEGEPALGNRDGELFGPVDRVDARLRPGVLRLCQP